MIVMILAASTNDQASHFQHHSQLLNQIQKLKVDCNKGQASQEYTSPS
jgi:hypothetical protein